MQEDGTQEVLKKACKEMVAPRAAPRTGEMSLTAAGTRLPPVEVCEKLAAPWPPPWNPGGVMTMPLAISAARMAHVKQGAAEVPSANLTTRRHILTLE
jgi:hypothetical protein